MAGIGVVVNPRSRRNLRDPKAAHRLTQTLGDHGVVREARSIDELYRIAEDFKRLEIDVLGISGGDGTNHVTITGFLNVYAGMALPQLAFLRGGTMNTVANSVGINHGKPEGLLGRIMRAYAARASRPLQNVERHVMQVGTHYGFLFGNGVVSGFLTEYYRAPERSPLVAAQTLLRSVGSTLVQGELVRRIAAPFRGSVRLDDGTEWGERDYLTITGGTVDQVGLNFRPFRRFQERPNTFHLLGIFATPLQLVPELVRIWQARPLRPGRAYDATPSSAVLRPAFDGAYHYMIDGDLHEAKGELTISTGPVVKILVGT